MICKDDCGVKHKVAEIDEHRQICPKRKIQCDECTEKIQVSHFIKHIQENHRESLIEKFDISCQKSLRRKIGGSNYDRTAPKKNLRGIVARIGETGKFYCGGHSETCNLLDCCDGCCGKTNGCNCRACMLLDVEARTLPPGFLVNRAGRACRVSQKNNKVYCGAKTQTHSDKRCGPFEGDSCPACQRMTQQMNTMYAGINEFGVVKY